MSKGTIKWFNNEKGYGFINGKEDIIFPIDASKRGFKTVESIYKKAGYRDNLRFVETPKGHYYCPDITWENINDMFNK